MEKVDEKSEDLGINEKSEDLGYESDYKEKKKIIEEETLRWEEISKLAKAELKGNKQKCNINCGIYCNIF
jgi:hypothetical protein